MPFVKETVEMKREQFVQEVLAKKKSKSALCREYQISRPTGDLWIARYENGEGLSDKSKAPFHTANKTPEKTEEKIVNARLKEPALGAKKIRQMLINAGEKEIPSVSTVNAILHRNKLISKEASLAATPCKRFEKEVSNMMWQCDFKGNYECGDGNRCHPLSIVDDHSRFCISADAKANEQYEGTAESFLAAFEMHGLPDVLLCDNGNPWGASQSGGVTKFEVWLMELGVLTIHIRPKHPQTQGKVERFNGSFKAERLKFRMPDNLADADIQRQEYRNFYNNERPHHALNLDVPAKHYEPSKRPFTSKIDDWDYGEGYETRIIKKTGYLTYGGQGYFLGEAYRQKTIAIKPSSVDGYLNLYFRQFKIGSINLHENSISSRKIYLIDNDPRSVVEDFRKS